MRDASFAVIREIGVETGGSNIQFAVNPENGRMVVIEMNPRVSRSSALASKATGFPIAKIAAKLAVGYTLDEIKNDITRETPACFEPTIDYCVVKVPRFTFEKFPQADATLTTQMKSVGEAMAIGRTFKEALQKALRSLEIKRFGLCGDGYEKRVDPETLRRHLSVPNAERIFHLAQAFQDGMEIEEVFALTKIDRWFLRNVQQIVATSAKLSGTQTSSLCAQWSCTPLNLKQRRRCPLSIRAERLCSEVLMSTRDIHQDQAEPPALGAGRRDLFRYVSPVADAMPARLATQWREELQTWRQFHPEPWDAQAAREYRKRFLQPREDWPRSGATAAARYVSPLRPRL